MFPFKVGLMSLVFPLAMCALYLLGRQVRRFIAYADNTSPPRERAKVYLVLIALMGFICGSLFQPTFDMGMQCKAYQQPVISCTVSQMFNQN
ncbi:hypothetical protein ACIOAU_15690 [Pseudomonas sp. NPDC088322]|uniref:hypothetical protein n=1 Tax=Pseudomonas sp. NPDC088322 TaxID=3364452 RepID=UPI00380D1218